MLKETVKDILSNVYFPIRSKMSATEAYRILEKHSPKPSGTCFTQNQLNVCYDLQIIVPAYNVEKYIVQCLDSIFKQKTEYKVLVSVVNDGSTDKTATLLQEYAKRLRGGITLEAVTQENKGLSGARNTALKSIKGQYVTFLDSDDVMENGAIQTMLDKAFKYDAEILQGSWYEFYEEKRKDCIISKEGILKDNRGVFAGYPWGKLYKYTVLEHFQFPEGFWFEDTPLSFIIAAMPYRCVAIQNIVYGYRYNPNGITATSRKNVRSVESYWITEECLKEFLQFGLSYDQRAYEYLLRQSLMNEKRTCEQPRKVREAQFILTAKLMDEYFAGFCTPNTRMKRIENVLRKRQYIQFELLKLKT